MDKIVENLKKLSKEYYDHFREAQDKITQLTEVPLAKSLVGNCYKYFNGYGINEKWWMYTKVLASKGTTLRLEIFQEDYYGKIEFDYDKSGYAGQFQNSAYSPITQKEYYKQQKKLINKLNRKYKYNTKK